MDLVNDRGSMDPVHENGPWTRSKEGVHGPLVHVLSSPVCLYLVSLIDFILTKKLQRKEIPARSTCHVSRERAVLDLIALRKHDSAIISKLRKKYRFLTYML